MIEMEKITREMEDCEGCQEDDPCEEHSRKLRMARNRQELRSDPQRNRIGVRGDPTPDREYGR